MKLFNVTFGAVSYVVAAETAEEISAHTAADDVKEIDGANVVPISVAELPDVEKKPENVVVIPVADGANAQN